MRNMPISKGREGPQKPSPTQRVALTRHVRTSSSDSDPLHQRPITERSPRLGDHRSPRGTQSDPPPQKKLGTRITDLETQLVQAQHELKSLKYQLASAERERKKAQEELHKGTKKIAPTRKAVVRTKPDAVKAIQKPNPRDKPDNEVLEDIHRETDVFEVPPVEKKEELSQCSVEEDVKETKSPNISIIEEKEKENLSLRDEVASKSEEIDQLRTMMEEKEKKIEAMSEENESLKKLLDEAKSEIALTRTKEEEMTSKVNELGKDLELSRVKEAQLKEKLSEVEMAKEELDNEMKKMKVQTEQWRKAADAAASVLSGGVGKIPERCSSMDNHFNSIFEPPPITGFGGYLGSPGPGDDQDDGFGAGKKKGSGIRMLGDLWKKKGQK